MSGGAAVTGRNAPELVRAGDPAKPWRSRGDYTAGAFRPTKEGMALTALGSLDPETADVSPQRLGGKPKTGERPFAKDPDRQVRHRRTSVRRNQVSQLAIHARWDRHP